MAAKFSEQEREILVALKGVGPTVIARLEQMGFSSLDDLATADVEQILQAGAAVTGSSCWKNSPQARRAITAAVECARTHGGR
ncbi:MAG: helix-hairpin-helix domain-containing protein [Corynebacterium sp.]|uniref:helix-hairpin-helix domain-containing protein n=1 Tax=Corynebacterium sp. TaxID=1720 RepID=UPI0026DC3B8F|nr:helix-hairpin-helix domain-containing protein [Corynebacterium sp.]MDO4761787.1 helix-hairpin-helix domain-containing protein [Corynebacterium sp.]